MDDREGYAPEWSDDALRIMRQRTADDRARFALGFLPHVARMVDVGCGPGTITMGIARAAGPGAAVLGVDREQSQVDVARDVARHAGLTNTRFEQGSAYDLPLDDRTVDLVLAHAVLEHLGSPRQALAEFRRVLRGHGVLAIASSDWSSAHLDPWNDDVEEALQGHYLLRRRAGGDPFMGGALPKLVLDAGYVDVEVEPTDRVDMAYDQLARYVGTRIEAALDTESAVGADGKHDDQLWRAARAARRWATREGAFTQRWVEVTARAPGPLDAAASPGTAGRAVPTRGGHDR